MPITISGSTGIAGVNGSAGTPAIQGTDTDSGVYFSGSQVGLSSNGAGTTMTIDGSGNVTYPGTVVMSSPFAMRNKIINGAMVIDQRNAGASVTPNNSYTLDRWVYENSQTGKATVQQNAGSVTPPNGFSNYLGVVSTSAYSVGASDTFLVTHKIEGFNIADFAWGTSGAQPITLSFWVRSSLTGSFGGSIANNGTTRTYLFSYSINSANTWEYKTITIPGDTTGTWLTNNGIGLVLRFGLGSGSTFSGAVGWQTGNIVQPTGTQSLVGTNGATFYLTGVQLEVGSVATPFERRLYGTELQLCQRYYQSYPAYTFRALGYSGGAGGSAGGSSAYSTLMRATPTVSGGYAATTNIGNGPFHSPTQAGFAYTANTSGTGNYSMQLDITTFSAEL